MNMYKSLLLLVGFSISLVSSAQYYRQDMIAHTQVMVGKCVQSSDSVRVEPLIIRNVDMPRLQFPSNGIVATVYPTSFGELTLVMKRFFLVGERHTSFHPTFVPKWNSRTIRLNADVKGKPNPTLIKVEGECHTPQDVGNPVVRLMVR